MAKNSFRLPPTEKDGQDWAEVSRLVSVLRRDITSLSIKIPNKITDTLSKLETLVSKDSNVSGQERNHLRETKEDLIELETETMDSWIVASGSSAGLNINSLGRQLTDNLHKLKETIKTSKEFIDLSIGDPTHYASETNDYLLPSPIVVEALSNIVKNGEYNGYGPSHGHVIAREALLKKYGSSNVPNMSISDIFITSACTDALNIAISSVADPNDIVFLPKPGIGRFTTICKRFHIIPKYYNLIIDDNIPGGGKIDLEDLENEIKKCVASNKNGKNKNKNKVKGILINNPANPSGSVFSKSNLRGLLSIAEKYAIPIISDEIYDHIVFGDDEDEHKDTEKERKFWSIGRMTSRAPVIMCGGISKTFLVPGWRMGWLILYDPKGIGIQIKKSISNLMTANPSQNTLVQAIIPKIFDNVPNSYYIKLNNKLSKNAKLFYNGFKKIPQLTPIKPNGAMYILTKLNIELFDNNVIKNDIDFMYKLMEEESIFVFCGSIFGMPDHFRTLILPPENVIDQVVQRIESFCQKYGVMKSEVLHRGAHIVSKI